MNYKYILQNFYLFILLIFQFSCNIPKDQENTWENIQKDGLHIGVNSNPPYTFQKDSSYTGSEIELIQAFADKHKLKLTYEPGNETDLIDKLENYKIDILVGGFTKKTVWKEKVGLTAPYDKGGHVILIAKGENKLLYFLESFLFNLKLK
ncbi:extracellular solute-binding protein (family 3) [Gillisia sp. Hel_I_86]|uniref:substrate-binding periplasmic protein n=1 Tax=Gillisia sp. Hel_I_86 TaxID=1249981 RepID=UPI00119ADFA4|nr:transporter substrate-binding domain-containing protein [Gillisia sp. Hel_I_86]TVZ28517.1 extracellular solute-binding protein (family 3) [Gillisia sp. Hel_I_86]